MVKVKFSCPSSEIPQVLRMVQPRSERGVVVVATETPVDRFDDKRGLYREVLLMSGVRFRGGRNQIPIVDSHDDTTVRNILGSVRNLTIDRNTGELFGEYAFSSTLDASDTEKKIAEGHITDFSITALPIDGTWIDRGQSYTTERGEVIEGPAHIITAWEPHNASVCATGADVNSIVRRSYTDLKRKERSMDEAMLSQLSSVGVPEGVTDPNSVIAFLLGKLQSNPSEEASEPMPSAIEPVESMAAEQVPVAPVEEVQKMDEAVKEEVARALAADRKRRQEIIADCKLAKLERSFADQLCDSGISADEARKQILKQSATQTVTRSASDASFSFVDGTDPNYETRVTVTESADDKFTDAVRDGLIARSMQNARMKVERKLAPGHEEFARLGLLRVASAVLARQGLPVNRMDNVAIARAALGNRSVLRQYRVERSDMVGAYNTTGSFPNILLDAASKTLLAGYEEAEFSWSRWARQAPSVDDFKAINRIRIGESPDLEEVPENKPYPEKPVSDIRTSYKVSKYGAIFSVSWETVVNDDLDALSRVPAMHGNAARRKQNKAVYDILTSNPTMADTFSLFSASHPSGDNTSGSAAAPGVGTLNTGFNKMMVQKGVSSSTILGIMPRYIIVPAAYSATAAELVTSTSYAVSNGNSNIVNIYGPTGTRPIEVVVEPYLDASSTTTWYLAADPSQIDTVELTFLSGEESPVLEAEQDFEIDAYKYKVRQTFGVAAIDWRGLYRNA